MQEPTLEDILSENELENLGELDEKSGWGEHKPVRPEFRRYLDPELSTVATGSYNMAHNLGVSLEDMTEKGIENALSSFHETVARRPGENPVFVSTQVEDVLDETPVSAYMRLPDGVYPVTVHDYDALQDVINSEDFQELFYEHSHIEKCREMLNDELLQDNVIVPVLTSQEGLPQRLTSGLLYSPETPLTADPNYSPDKQKA